MSRKDQIAVCEDDTNRKFAVHKTPDYYIPIRWSVNRKVNEPAAEFLDDHRALEPPDPIPNSEVKHFNAEDSVSENRKLPIFFICF